MDEELERRALIGIAAVTVATGAQQAALPGISLRVLRVADAPSTRHFFGTVGMFMVVCGGTLLDALLRRSDDPGPPFWAGMQKLGAVVAVGLGVRRGLMAPLALPVAVFDLVSALLALDYWRRRRP